MIDLEYIRSFFPPTIAKDSRFDRYMLKEYLQLMIIRLEIMYIIFTMDWSEFH